MSNIIKDLCKCIQYTCILAKFTYLLTYEISAVYPANCRSPRTRANSGELERTRANSARIRHRFANTDTPPNSGERSPEYAERSPEFGGVRPGSPEFARTPPRTGERFARKFVRGKKLRSLLTSVRRKRVRRELGSRRT